MPTTPAESSNATSGTSAPQATAPSIPRSSLVQDPIDVIPNRLAFACYRYQCNTITASSGPSTSDTWANSKESSGLVHWIIDSELVYARFFADFGPLQLGQIVRFCRTLHQKLTRLAANETLLVLCRDHPHDRANAVTLLVIFQVVQHGLPVAHAWKVFGQLDQRPFGFRDASMGICSFFISAMDCAAAFQRVIQLQLWSYNEFSVETYELLDELANGDINWVLPGKLLAFSGPLTHPVPLEQGKTTLVASDYAKLFKQLGVGCVIRLNETVYDKKPFLLAGIRHIDLEFPDGSAPNDDVLYAFLRICQREQHAVAVHCKAGLGRTGTLIAAFLMQQHHFTAREAIAWCRMCRPGSIVGIQQHFLMTKQVELWQKQFPAALEATTSAATTPARALSRRRRKTPVQTLRLLPNVKTHQ